MRVRTHLATLVEEFRQHAADTAVVDHRGNRSYRTTYGQIAELAGRFAAELERRNVVPGERVVLWAQNSAAWISVFFGCLLRGVIVVPLDAAGSKEFAERVVIDVAPKLIVGDAQLLSALRIDVPLLPLSKLPASLPVEPAFAVHEAVDAQTPFQIVFTSGTTSEPKGIVHTHRNVLASLQPIEAEIAKYCSYERWIHPLRFLHSIPLSHVFGQFMGLWIPPLLAAELHFVQQIDARRMTELIHHERISVLVAVPRILQLLQTHLLGRFKTLAQNLEHTAELSVWRRWWKFRRIHRVLGWKFWAVVSGGAVIPPEQETFWNRLGLALVQGYGMTETAALITLNHPFRIGHGTIGRVLPGREVRLGDEGEILVRGDVLSTATWRHGAMQQREGEWLATGDLATKNESGELQFLGRKGDVIVTGAGMNVHPADLEQALNRQPGVRGCAVVPCTTTAGPEPVAVVLFSGSDDALEHAVGQANRGLAGYQQMRRVLRWPELQFPYTSTGKLLRRRIAQWACTTLTIQQQSPASSKALHGDDLVDLIAVVTGERAGGSEDTQRLSEDLHLDSLGRVQLQTELEQRLELEFADDAMAAVQTLGELRQLIRSQSATPAALAAPTEQAGDTIVGAQQLQTPGAVPSQINAPESSSFIYPRWPWSWPIRAARVAFIELVMRPLIRLLAAPQVAFASDALPQTPLLVIANHVSAYDGALVLYALPPKLRRRMAIAMAGEMLADLRRGKNQENWLYNLLAPLSYGLVTALFNVFPLPRMHGFRQSFEYAGEAMDRGYSVLVFPEGTRRADGEVHPFRQGIGLLAQQSRVSVLPVALIGLDRISRSGWFRSGDLKIHVGEAIAVDEGADPAELTRTFEEKLRQLYTGPIAAKSASKFQP